MELICISQRGTNSKLYIARKILTKTAPFLLRGDERCTDYNRANEGLTGVVTRPA